MTGEIEVWIGTSLGDADTTTSFKCGGPMTAGETSGSGYSAVAYCQGLTYGFVTVKKVNEGYLTLAELEVYEA